MKRKMRKLIRKKMRYGYAIQKPEMRSMKKKLALLLALIMVLSLAPVNVMAAPAPGTGVSPQLSQPSEPGGAQFTVTINVFDVIGRLNAGEEEVIVISLGDARFVRHVYQDPPATGTDGWNFPTSVTDPARFATGSALFVGVGYVDFEMWVLNNTTAEVRLRAVATAGSLVPGQIVPTGIGGLAIPLPFNIRATHIDSRLAAYLHNIAPGRLLTQGPLTNFGTGVNITYDEPVVFEWDANLDHIIITEARLGSMAPMDGTPRDLDIRLIAPVGYTWRVPIPADDNDGADPIWNTHTTTSFLHSGDFATISWARPMRVGFNAFTRPSVQGFFQGNNQQEMVIRTTATRSTVPHLRDRLGVLSIRGLTLVPDYDAPTEGDLNVRVQIGRGQIGYNADTSTYFNFGVPASGDTQAIRAWNNRWDGTDGNLTGGNQTLHVATRVLPRLTLTTVEEDLPQLRSGYAMGTSPIRPLVITEQWWVPGTEPTIATTGRTAIMRIQENVVNALDLSRGRPVTFEVPEGFIVTGAEWRYYRGNNPRGTDDAYHLGWGGVANDTVSGFGPLPQLDGSARGHGGRVTRPAPGQNQNPEVVFGDRTVTLNPWLTQHDRWTQQRDYTLRLEVRLHVSVSGGSAGRGIDELEVTVTGLGVNNLPQNDTANVIKVAEVYDPIYIQHHGDPALVNLIGLEQNINHTPAGSLTITETAGGMLQRGTILWLDVVEFYNIGHPLRVSRYDVFTDATSGLGLMVRDVTPTGVGAGGEANWRVWLEVTRETAANGPGGTITFDDMTLFGHVYEGERYYLVVSGPAVAETFRPVWNSFSAAANQNVFSTFTNFPYYIEDIIRPIGTAYQRANPMDGVEIETGVAFRGVANPILWRRLPGMSHEGGFVSMRAFALAAGVTDDNEHINWANRVATVSGFDYLGRWIVVSVSPDLATVTITTDGITTTNDIGILTGGLTGAPGTVRPIHEDGTIYLPLRLMFDVFGYSEFYTLARQGQRAVISAR